MTPKIEELQQDLNAIIASGAIGAFIQRDAVPEISEKLGMPAQHIRLWGMNAGQEGIGQLVIVFGDKIRFQFVISVAEEPFFDVPRTEINVESETQKIILQSDWKRALTMAFPTDAEHIIDICEKLEVRIQPSFQCRYGGMTMVFAKNKLVC